MNTRKKLETSYPRAETKTVRDKRNDINKQFQQHLADNYLDLQRDYEVKELVNEINKIHDKAKESMKKAGINPK